MAGDGEVAHTPGVLRPARPPPHPSGGKAGHRPAAQRQARGAPRGRAPPGTSTHSSSASAAHPRARCRGGCHGRLHPQSRCQSGLTQGTGGGRAGRGTAGGQGRRRPRATAAAAAGGRAGSGVPLAHPAEQRDPAGSRRARQAHQAYPGSPALTDHQVVGGLRLRQRPRVLARLLPQVPQLRVQQRGRRVARELRRQLVQALLQDQLRRHRVPKGQHRHGVRRQAVSLVPRRRHLHGRLRRRRLAARRVVAARSRCCCRERAAWPRAGGLQERSEGGMRQGTRKQRRHAARERRCSGKRRQRRRRWRRRWRRRRRQASPNGCSGIGRVLICGSHLPCALWALLPAAASTAADRQHPAGPLRDVQHGARDCCHGGAFRDLAASTLGSLRCRVAVLQGLFAERKVAWSSQEIRGSRQTREQGSRRAWYACKCQAAGGRAGGRQRAAVLRGMPVTCSCCCADLPSS